MARRFISVVRGPPWSLCFGDVEQNVSDLVSLEEAPDEPLLRKVWTLGRLGSAPSVPSDRSTFPK